MNMPEIGDDSEKKRIIVFEGKHNLGCLFVPSLNLFNSKILECFCSAV